MAEDKLRVSRVYKDFDLAFTKNPVTSDLSKKTDVAAVKQAIKVLLMTNFYERPFSYSKGANLRSYLFQPADQLTANVIRKNIQQVIEAYEPRARIDEITVSLGSDDISYRVYIRFIVLGFPAPQTLTANLQRLR